MAARTVGAVSETASLICSTNSACSRGAMPNCAAINRSRFLPGCHVFPLLFFKRISNVHDDEYRAALEESNGDEEAALFPENYGFQVPEHCHWRDVRAVTTNVGQALQTAPRGIEQANPHTLYGESIYDPACGTGGMLLEAIHHVQETRGDVRTLWGKLYGQEKNHQRNYR